MNKGKNIAYVRVSSTDQNEARQKEALKKHNIDKWFIEKASGKDLNRPKLQELLDYIREDDIVYVEEFSRLGRSTADLLATVKAMQMRSFWPTASVIRSSILRSRMVGTSSLSRQQQSFRQLVLSL